MEQSDTCRNTRLTVAPVYTLGSADPRSYSRGR